VLVLLMRGICELCHWNGLRWHGIHTEFHDDWFRHLSDITVIKWLDNTVHCDSVYTSIYIMPLHVSVSCDHLQKAITC
jgi:hypothetical protein